MALKGTLHTVTIPEIVRFLADNAKTGELHVTGDVRQGRLWFEEGSIAGFDVADSEEAFEAIFELLRNEEGDFDFSKDSVRPGSARTGEDEGREVASALEQAQARLLEWREILPVVPSLDHRVELVGEVPEDSVLLERHQWAMVVAVGDGRTVAEVIAHSRLREFEGCRAIRDLVVADVAKVTEPASATDLYEPSPLPAYEPAPLDAYDSAPDAEVGDTAVAPFGAEEGDSPQADGDRYASLRAAVLGIGEDLPGEDGEVESEEAPALARSALQAMLSEVTARPFGDPPEPVDGLADRGPWRSDELAAFDQDAESSFPAEPESTDTVTDEPTGEIEAVSDNPAPGEETLNRGLLLKFLSSVRN